MKKKIIGLCIVFLFLSAAMGFTETWPICRRLEYYDTDYTRYVRTVEVSENFDTTEIYFDLDDSRFEQNLGAILSLPTSRARGGNNYNCIGAAGFDRRVFGGLDVSVDYVPGRSYGVVMKDDSGRTVMTFLVQK